MQPFPGWDNFPERGYNNYSGHSSCTAAGGRLVVNDCADIHKSILVTGLWALPVWNMDVHISRPSRPDTQPENIPRPHPAPSSVFISRPHVSTSFSQPHMLPPYLASISHRHIPPLYLHNPIRVYCVWPTENPVCEISFWTPSIVSYNVY